MQGKILVGNKVHCPIISNACPWWGTSCPLLNPCCNFITVSCINILIFSPHLLLKISQWNLLIVSVSYMLICLYPKWPHCPSNLFIHKFPKSFLVFSLHDTRVGGVNVWYHVFGDGMKGMNVGDWLGCDVGSIPRIHVLVFIRAFFFFFVNVKKMFFDY